ncbi:hypothetical protein [Fuchsiella alkaliacetigena]|uniref:hypothetical protein n=1 Tax=Fuchsiella alkaliacetigena TaxID=957042 RepID=UPI00200B45C4|nr:hypothetical protein [Fuchsiella alkaliacetigena]MCK8824702.1 hypothetical protein [Fuchsiella alkaliacetigena]
MKKVKKTMECEVITNSGLPAAIGEVVEAEWTEVIGPEGLEEVVDMKINGEPCEFLVNTKMGYVYSS